MNKEELKVFIKQGLQEICRILVLGFVATLPYLYMVFERMSTTGEFTINPYIFIGLFSLAFLKGIDKGLHKSGVAEQGLTRF